MALNYLCANDVSDEDCRKCAIHGIRYRCIANCPDFADIRQGMPEDMARLRGELMELAGLKDSIPMEGQKWE